MVAVNPQNIEAIENETKAESIFVAEPTLDYEEVKIATDNNIIATDYDGNVYLLDITGKPVNKSSYENIKYAPKTDVFICDMGLDGTCFIDGEGNRIYSDFYDDAYEVGNNIFEVWKEEYIQIEGQDDELTYVQDFVDIKGDSYFENLNIDADTINNLIYIEEKNQFYGYYEKLDAYGFFDFQGRFYEGELEKDPNKEIEYAYDIDTEDEENWKVINEETEEVIFECEADDIDIDYSGVYVIISTYTLDDDEELTRDKVFVYRYDGEFEGEYKDAYFYYTGNNEVNQGVYLVTTTNTEKNFKLYDAFNENWDEALLFSKNEQFREYYDELGLILSDETYYNTEFSWYYTLKTNVYKLDGTKVDLSKYNNCYVSLLDGYLVVEDDENEVYAVLDTDGNELFSSSQYYRFCGVFGDNFIVLNRDSKTGEYEFDITDKNFNKIGKLEVPVAPNGWHDYEVVDYRGYYAVYDMTKEDDISTNIISLYDKNGNLVLDHIDELDWNGNQNYFTVVIDGLWGVCRNNVVVGDSSENPTEVESTTATETESATEKVTVNETESATEKATERVTEKATVKATEKVTEKTTEKATKAVAKKPGKVKKFTVKNNKKRALSVKYNKAKNAQSYIIQYSKDKKFKKAVVSIDTNKTSRTIKKLKKGKTYWVRVCGVNDGVKGEWTKAKKVKINK